MISKTEALSGANRALTLPGGRRVPIAVPAGTQDGQVIYLEGQGEPSSSGGPTGSLIITFAIKQEEANLQSEDIEEETSSTAEAFRRARSIRSQNTSEASER